MKPKPKRHQRTVKIVGISKNQNIGRFKHFIEKSFESREIADEGEYVVAHYRIVVGENLIEVIVYTSDKIYISSSPYTPPDSFNQTATKIAKIAQGSVKKLAETRPLTLQRAKSLVDFVSKLNPGDEYQRMVMVILSDTSNEIVLREMMKSLKISGPPLDAGIPDKIKIIKERGGNVYKENEIRSVRELRNTIVHYGNIPDKDQAIQAFKVASGILQ